MRTNETVLNFTAMLKANANQVLCQGTASAVP
jgi:hypothetical protein